MREPTAVGLESTAHPQSASRVPQLATRVADLLLSLRFWSIACVLWAGCSAWATRHQANPDGLSYLDMASEALTGGPARLVNGYWSPLYPAVISVFLRVFRPAPSDEFPLIHLANFAVFLLVLACFSFFVRSWLAPEPAFGRFIGRKEKVHLAALAFFLFLWTSIHLTGVDIVSPDLAVSGIVFLAAGIGCRMCIERSHWARYAALGLVLGLGYYVKAAMFPLGLALLAIFLLRPPSRNVRRTGVLLSALVFVAMSAPLAGLMSARARRPTIGESGRLNYLWYANGFPIFAGWTGGSATAQGVPEHPLRRVFEKPVVLEFVSPVAGTYPLWYDPSYWHAGAKTRFDFRRQAAALLDTVRVYKDILAEMSMLLAGAIVLGFLALQRAVAPAPDRGWLWLFAWPLAAYTMYALVHVERRFLGSFCVLFWLATYSILLARVRTWVRDLVLAMVLCVAVISTGSALITGVTQAVREHR